MSPTKIESVEEAKPYAAANTGLEFLRAVMNKTIKIPAHEHLGFIFKQAAEGLVVIEFAPQAHNDNGLGMVHGAYMAGLADAAAGYAFISVLPKGHVCVMAELSTRFRRSASLEGGVLTAMGKVVDVKNTNALVEAEIRDQHGDLITKGTGTAIVRAL